MEDKRKEAPVSEALPRELEEVKKAGAPLYELLTKEYDPMCYIVVNWNGVKVVRSESGVVFP